ncbi:proton channel OtopLc-like [Liolophura sinensis]|uniref:proton channel OtopLc-like n=1 Tax=Liolophura sinensis TaxID=3198878 RepID=UPI003158B7A7
MYAMFLTILGAVLPIAELFAQEKHPLLFEVFYIYMYGGSILFLGYVYTYLLRTRAAKKTTPSGQSQKKKHRKRKVSVDKVNSNTGSFYLRLGAVAFGIGSMIHSGLQFGDYFEVEVIDPCRHAVFAIRPIVHLMFTFVQLYFVFLNSKMCINRYKTIARFGLMHMVATNICVWFNTIVEETLHQLGNIDSSPHHDLAAVLYSQEHTTPTPNRTLLADVNRRHSINVSARGRDYGPVDIHGTIAHLTTTAAQLIRKHSHLNPQNVTHERSFPSPVLPVVGTHFDCKTSQLMLSVLETVSPYLYPCSIEYSLICAGIVYTLWKNIGKRVMAIKSEDDKDDRAVVHRLRVDCSKSSRGLFLGILILVGTIITMVVFFVLVKTPTYNRSAIMVEYLSEITLFTLSTIAVVIAATRMRYLRFNVTRDTDFEEVLILISLTGDYMFQMLSIVAAIFDKEQFASRLSIAACLLGITQSTIQTMFVLDGLRRCTRTAEQGRQKSGREYVTFLLITNIAMWCINTFEAERTVANPVQMHYYGALAWNILSHISIPLAIFFRFHSTVCLSNIWKGAWKN